MMKFMEIYDESYCISQSAVPSSAYLQTNKMASFDLAYDPETGMAVDKIEVLMEVFADDNIFDELSTAEFDGIIASTSNNDAVAELNQAFSEEQA